MRARSSSSVQEETCLTSGSGCYFIMIDNPLTLYYAEVVWSSSAERLHNIYRFIEKPAKASYQYSLDRSTRAYVSRSSITTLQLKHTKHSGWYLCSPATWKCKRREADFLPVPSIRQRGKTPTGGCRLPQLWVTSNTPRCPLPPRPHLLSIPP